jgi:hypothetical protein
MDKSLKSIDVPTGFQCISGPACRFALGQARRYVVNLRRTGGVQEQAHFSLCATQQGGFEN